MIIRSFIQLSRAWYSEANLKDADFIDEISIQAEKSGGLICEFSLRWFDLADDKAPAPRLEIFDDAWTGFFEHFGDFLQMLGGYDQGNWTPDKISAKLVELGIEDATPSESQENTSVTAKADLIKTCRKTVLVELTEIARSSLGIETLVTRNSDDLDFHELSVWQIKEALQTAYDQGAAGSA